jgi:hypothetical protein
MKEFYSYFSGAATFVVFLQPNKRRDETLKIKNLFDFLVFF